ncbi:PHP domain-containing protein [Dehalococcoidia bacterium]|jgi:predicted metal-dependent phosphoesterase TrpH|nr:PHP domain-containing protein [Dehalococcoidia bacterium]
MLKADFHIHTNYSPDSEVSPEQLVERCLKVGLNCIAVTDHNTIEGALAVKELAPFTVIIGEEIRSTQGEITGLFLTECIPADLPPADTVKLIKDQGGIVSIPHPFDRFRSEVISAAALESITDFADIVEIFNARNSMSADDRKARKYAQDHGLLTSAVSDAHTIIELGRTYTAMPDFDGSPTDFKRALAEATLVGRRMNPLIHIATSFTKIKKRLQRNRG